MAHWTVLAFLMPALLAVVFWPLGLHADPDTHSSYASASCFRKETYNTTSKVKVQVPVNKTRYDWCLGGFMRCVVYKVEMAEKEINVTEIRSRIVEMCCPGMIPAPGTPVQSSNESLQCIPAPGSGQPPITSSPAPIVTTTSKEVCKTGLWGRGCSHTCSCGGAPCNQDTGACLPCSPNDTSCAPFTSTTGSTTTSSTTTAVPTTPSSTPPTTTSPTPQPSTTSTTTMIATLATTKTSTLRSVETSPRVSLSNASDFPVAASTQTPRTVSITSPTTRLSELTTVRPIIATREQGTIERRKEAPGKSMAQPAKTTALPIDPEAVNRVDIGYGKPKPDTIPTNISSETTPPPPSVTSLKPTLPGTRPASSSDSPFMNPQNTTAVPRETTAVPRETTAVPRETTAVPRETTAVPRETTAVPRETSAVPRETTAVPRETTAVPRETTAVPRATTATDVRTPLIVVVPTTKLMPKQSTPKVEDVSSEETDSDEADDDEDDDDGDDDEDDDLENTRDYKLRQETILSPPGIPPTRIDKIQTKINGSQHLMTWTFQTDFSVGPPIKSATPTPRKNAIPPGTEDRNASVLLLDKNSDDKITMTTITYGVKPWMPALNLATVAPTLNDHTTDRNTLHKERIFDKPAASPTTTPKPTIPTTVGTTTLEASTFKNTITTVKLENIANSSTLSASMMDKTTTENPQNRTVATPVHDSTATRPTSQLTSIVTGAFGLVQNISTSTVSTQRTPRATDEPSGSPNATVKSLSNAATTSLLSMISSTHTTSQYFPATEETSTITADSPKTFTTPAITNYNNATMILPKNSNTTILPENPNTLTTTKAFDTPTLISTSTVYPTSGTSAQPLTTTQLPGSQPSNTSTTLEIPPYSIPTGSPPQSVQTVLSSTVQTTSSTLGQTPLQGHIAKPTANVNQEASVEYSFTTLGSVHDISQLGSLPGAGQPSSPSTVEAGGAGVTVATIAIALAILTILCVLVTFVRTLKRRNKRRPRDVPPPSPPLISAWHSEPHYSETFAVPAPVQPTAVPTFSDQFEQPVVEHVYQEITPLANVIETSVPPTDTSTRQDTGPTKVLVKLRTVETYVVR